MMLGGVWLTRDMIRDMAAELGVHRRTVARWFKAGKLPKSVEALLDITRNGNLGRIHEEWDGWNIDAKTGELVTPIVYRARRRTYTWRDIFKIQITYQQLSALKSINAELSAKAGDQEKAIEELRAKVANQQRAMERLESCLAELTSTNVVPMDAPNQDRGYLLSSGKPGR